jgi:sigma-B regulation protein RsbU (phosphoserine phosphatase)
MYIEGKGLTGIKIKLELMVIFLLIVSFIKYLQEYFRKRDHITSLMLSSLILCIFSEIAFTQYFIVYDIYNYLGHVFRIIAFFIIFRVMFVTNVQKPYYELAKAKNKIKSYADNLDVIVEQRTRELSQINQKLLDDLEYARDIQKAMLPSVLPDSKKVSFSPKYFPAEKVGGDYYNIFKIDSHNIAMCIGDVSGHGVSAAMLTVFLNQSIQAVKEEADSGHIKINTPSQVLKSMFNDYNKASFKDEVYIVFFYSILNLNKMELTYSSAGLNVTPVILREGGIVDLEMEGFPICKIGEFYNVEYQNITVKLQKGDRIIICTDGLIEAENPYKEQYSFQRMKETLIKISGKSNKEIADYLEKDVFEFIDGNPIKDDITFIVTQIN